jgi:hypothetical protein
LATNSIFCRIPPDLNTTRTGIAYAAKVQGKDFFVYDKRDGWEKLFIAGVNIGAAKPDATPGNSV